MKSNTYSSMRIIYASLITGVTLFGAVTIFILQTGDLNTFSLNTMGIIAIIFGISAPVAGQFLYMNKIQSLKNETAATKLQVWKTFIIIRTAMIEAPCLFAVVNLLLGGGQLFVIVYALDLAWMIYNFPTRLKLKSDLDITDEDMDAY